MWDATVHDALTFLTRLGPKNATDMKRFKRMLAEQLVFQQLESKPKKRTVSKMEETNDEDDEIQSIGDILSMHPVL